MIDPITLKILQEQGVLEGYCLKCAVCGKVIEIVKDGQGVMSCCNQRMFVMSANPMSEDKIEEKKLIKKALKKMDRWGKEGMIIKKYVPAEKRTWMKDEQKPTKESVEELEELRKTRSGLERATRRLLDPAYIQRRKDLLRLRKQPSWYRKQLSQKIEKKEKVSPGFLKKVAKAPKLKGDKVQAAQARRQAAQRFGGYHKTADWQQREKEKAIKQKQVAKAKKKAMEKSLASQKAKQAAAYNKLLQKRLEKTRAYHEKDIEKRKEARKAKLAALKAKKLAAAEVGAEAGKKAAENKFSKYKSRPVKGFSSGPLEKEKKVGVEQRIDKQKLQNIIKESSVTFSAADIEKALGHAAMRDTYSGYHEKTKKEAEQRQAAGTIRGFLKMLRSEGFTTDEIKELIVEVLVEAEGMKKLPKGWDQGSLKKFSKSLTGKEGTKKGFFDKCVNKMKGKVDNPEGFCASVKDEMHGSTFWRGKGKSPQEAGKDVKVHRNVKRG